MHGISTDLLRSIRKLLHSPGFTIAATLTLALGIGATTAIFSVVHHVLLKPLPYPASHDLVGIWHTAPGTGIESMLNSPGAYLAYREENRVFEDIGVWLETQATVSGKDSPERVEAFAVTDGLLPLLGVQPGLGRLFTKQEDSPGGPSVVLLGYGYWQRRFGGKTAVLGEHLRIDGVEREVVGVLPAGFRLLEGDASVYVPLRLNPSRSIMGGGFGFHGIGRLKPGFDLSDAGRDLERMLPMAVERYGGITIAQAEEIGLRPLAHPLKDDVVGEVSSILWMLLGTVGLILAIACANVSNLFLVRADSRHREIALRTSLGATGPHLAIQFLMESLILSIAGGAIGLGFSQAGLWMVRQLAAQRLPRLHEVAIDPTVLVFTAVVALVTGLAFGSLPVLRYRRLDLSVTLAEGGRAGGGRPRRRGPQLNAAVEVAMALVLLITAGLMVRSFQALSTVDPGFRDPEEVLAIELAISRGDRSGPLEQAQLYRELLRRLAAIPGIASVGASSSVTLTGGSTWVTYVEDFPLPGDQVPASRGYKWVAGDYFDTMKNPLLAGRGITWQDVDQRRKVVVVTENFARSYWGEPALALGRRIRSNPRDPWREIVGVVGNVRDEGIDRPPRAVIYWPLVTEHFDGREVYAPRSMDFVIRAARSQSGVVEPLTLLPQIRQAVAEVSQELPVANVRTLDAILSESMGRTSFALVMLGIAAAVALALGAVGIYGVVSQVVLRRHREIGVRMALGARRGEVRRLVLKEGAWLAALGVVMGLITASLLTRLMSGLLYGVTPADPLTYAIAAAAVTGAVLLSTYLPARRASRTDPVEVLRWQ